MLLKKVFVTRYPLKTLTEALNDSLSPLAISSEYTCSRSLFTPTFSPVKFPAALASLLVLAVTVRVALLSDSELSFEIKPRSYNARSISSDTVHTPFFRCIPAKTLPTFPM